LFSLAGPNAVVSVSSVTVVVGVNETTSRTFSVTNVGDTELLFRLRDSGSSAGLRQIFPSRVLIQQPSGFTTANSFITYIDFDGLGLWRAPTVNSLEWNSFDPPLVKRTVSVSGLGWDLSYDTAWDGRGLWVTKAASGTDLRTRLARLDPYPPSGSTAVLLDQLSTLPNGYNLARVAWDGSQAWYAYFNNPVTVNGTTLAVTPRNGIRRVNFSTGACWYADSLWGFDFIQPGGGSDRRLISSINVTNAVRVDYLALPASVVNEGLAAQASDGFGRFIAITRATRISPYVATHFDLGIRYWLTCPDQTHQRNVLGVSESKTFTLQFDSSGLSPGEYKTLLWVDSNDSAKRRVTIPISLIVENRVAAAPSANNDVYFTDRDTTLQVAAPGVLQNDTVSPFFRSVFHHRRLTVCLFQGCCAVDCAVAHIAFSRHSLAAFEWELRLRSPKSFYRYRIFFVPCSRWTESLKCHSDRPNSSAGGTSYPDIAKSCLSARNRRCAVNDTDFSFQCRFWITQGFSRGHRTDRRNGRSFHVGRKYFHFAEIHFSCGVGWYQLVLYPGGCNGAEFRRPLFY
jgi:hypothetical protein